MAVYAEGKGRKADSEIFMSAGMQPGRTDSVLSRAESAIRRARGLTVAYSDFNNDEQQSPGGNLSDENTFGMQLGRHSSVSGDPSPSQAGFVHEPSPSAVWRWSSSNGRVPPYSRPVSFTEGRSASAQRSTVDALSTGRMLGPYLGASSSRRETEASPATGEQELPVNRPVQEPRQAQEHRDNGPLTSTMEGASRGTHVSLQARASTYEDDVHMGQPSSAGCGVTASADTAAAAMSSGAVPAGGQPSPDGENAEPRMSVLDAGISAAEFARTVDRITSLNPSQPVMAVANRLAALQRQQSETMRQLLRLRLEQLRLRQQQLAALQCLLRTEAACIDGSPLQLSAVQQAVDLLADSLADVHTVASALQWDGEVSEVAVVAHNVSEADARAEEVSVMARQLLSALRRHPLRTVDAAGGSNVKSLRGATLEEINRYDVETCNAETAVLGDPCCICLSDFKVGDSLRGLKCEPAECTHYFHKACIDEWLGLKASCPLCKFEVTARKAEDEAAYTTLGPAL